jgi:threonine/homoserine/homoserine lactone efflux protein
MSALAIATYLLVALAGLAYLVFFTVITIGGFFDLVYLLKSIRREALDAEDDGRVTRPTPKDKAL